MSIEVGVRTGDAIRQTAKSKSMNPQWAADRYVAERIVDSWALGMGPAPVVVTGGLLFPQHLRPTQDADVKGIRHYSNLEVQRGLQIISDHLERHEGISITSVSREPKEMDVGIGEPIRRWEIKARIGGSRGMQANTRIDLGVLRGPHSMPVGVVKRTFPSFLSKGRPFTCHAQPLESAAADHWIAMLTQTDRDRRLKHHADVILCHSMPLDLERVADEITRVLKYRGLPMSLCLPEPISLSWHEFSSRQYDWDRLRTIRHGLPELHHAFLDVGTLWSAVHGQLRANVARDARRAAGRHDLFDSLVASPTSPAPAFRPF